MTLSNHGRAPIEIDPRGMIVSKVLYRMQSSLSRSVMVKRLRHQSLKRGTLENGILLGAFVERHLEGMSAAELEDYEAIISENDVDLFNWLGGVQPVPERYAQSETFQRLCTYLQERRAGEKGARH